MHACFKIRKSYEKCEIWTLSYRCPQAPGPFPQSPFEKKTSRIQTLQNDNITSSKNLMKYIFISQPSPMIYSKRIYIYLYVWSKRTMKRHIENWYPGPSRKKRKKRRENWTLVYFKHFMEPKTKCNATDNSKRQIPVRKERVGAVCVWVEGGEWRRWFTNEHSMFWCTRDHRDWRKKNIIHKCIIIKMG